jgi:hypothetical protein
MPSPDPNPFQHPTTPAGRLRLAWQLASDNLTLACLKHRQQVGANPVLLIATADCALGRRFVVGQFGDKLPECLTGPVVIAYTEERWLAMFGPTDREAIGKAFADAPDDAMRVVFAVNGETLEFRTVPAPSAEALAASATPEGAAKWHADQNAVEPAAPPPAAPKKPAKKR